MSTTKRYLCNLNYNSIPDYVSILYYYVYITSA